MARLPVACLGSVEADLLPAGAGLGKAGRAVLAEA
jgi:hypothetical protein